MKTKIKCKGWTAMWNDGTPGWYTSEFIYDNIAAYTNLTLRKVFPKTKVYRCEITVRVLKDSKGRFIKKKAGA